MTRIPRLTQKLTPPQKVCASLLYHRLLNVGGVSNFIVKDCCGELIISGIQHFWRKTHGAVSGNRRRMTRFFCMEVRGLVRDSSLRELNQVQYSLSLFLVCQK